jgi:hypothetical protein
MPERLRIEEDHIDIDEIFPAQPSLKIISNFFACRTTNVRHPHARWLHDKKSSLQPALCNSHSQLSHNRRVPRGLAMLRPCAFVSPGKPAIFASWNFISAVVSVTSEARAHSAAVRPRPPTASSHRAGRVSHLLDLAESYPQIALY